MKIVVKIKSTINGYVKDKSGNFDVEPLSENQQFDRYVEISVTKDQGDDMYFKAWGIFWDEEDTYKLYTNNCSQKVTEILKFRGISIFGASDLIPIIYMGHFLKQQILEDGKLVL
ncbi:hypothetical protein CTER_2428 [Ruminiclostridium cellobioparum subsp. termitidis CT1112]|uniref:Uncharacterized protein n=1 Tax=Ruminiclostridium cellobioparum subsp. termitidis CT1112 TaxID=1195236 RepID=S0FR88_RUMCE|nr:hypothetical protein CTER_2428 [Ruminiclostridium cellobioparum subsp. termitidis CT1112]